MLSKFYALPISLRRLAVIASLMLTIGIVLACGASVKTTFAPIPATATPTATTVPPTATSIPPTATPVPPGNLVITAYCAALGTNTVGPCATLFQTLCVSSNYFYFHLHNSGGQAVHWMSTVTFPMPEGTVMTLSPASGTVNPGQTVTVTAVGQYGGNVDFTISWNGHAQTYDLFCAMP